MIKRFLIELATDGESLLPNRGEGLLIEFFDFYWSSITIFGIPATIELSFGSNAGFIEVEKVAGMYTVFFFLSFMFAQGLP